MTLDELNLEEPARVSEVGGQGALRRRLLDMGITPGTEVVDPEEGSSSGRSH